MKLITAIVQQDDAGRLVSRLIEQGFRATRLQSHGGFLRIRNSTVLIGVDDTRLEEALVVVRTSSRTRTHTTAPPPLAVDSGEVYTAPVVDVDSGGATVFVTHVEHYEQI